MEHDDYMFGLRDIWGEAQGFGISQEDFTRHVFVIGQTGTGKSALLKSLFIQAVRKGHGVGVLDPHGDVATELLDLLPRVRAEDVVHFAPSDQDFSPAFNPLADVPPPSRHLVASGLVSAMKSLFADSWGPRTQYLIFNCLMALLETPNATLLCIPRLLSDERYRRWVLQFVNDPMTSAFWHNEFARMEPRFRQEVIAPLQNKIGQVLGSPSIRRTFSAVKNRVSIRNLMDHQKIFIADLSKGKLGEEGSNLIGSLLVALFSHAAMTRADIPEDQREHFILFVDETPQFTTDAFAAALAELRKYRVAMVLFAQTTDALNEKVKSAVFGNVGSMISFRVSESDAQRLSRQYGDYYPASHFTGLDNHEIVVRLSQRGKQLQPFTGKTLPPNHRHIGRSSQILRRSRERYCNRSDIMDEKIARWMKRKNWG